MCTKGMIGRAWSLIDYTVYMNLNRSDRLPDTVANRHIMHNFTLLKFMHMDHKLFRTKLQYMENTIFIKDRRICVKPLRGRVEAIQKLQPPTTAKGCRSITGMVNFLSMFCLELQKLLKPINDLTMKGRQFIWGNEQWVAFKE